MPRVLPRQPRFAATDVVRAWEGVACDTADGVSHVVPRGTRLRGDHVVVRQCPWAFVIDAASDDEEPTLFPEIREPELRFTKPTRVRCRCRVLHGVAVYEKGSEFVVPPEVAEWLVSENLAEPA
jgi:hypothetical protein